MKLIEEKLNKFNTFMYFIIVFTFNGIILPTYIEYLCIGGVDYNMNKRKLFCWNVV